MKAKRILGPVLCAVVAHFLCSCTPAESGIMGPVPSGNAHRGRTLVSWYGCVACHQIATVRLATGKVGPPLTGIARRSYLAGRLPNTPENMMRWIRDPHTIDERTVMPDTGVTDGDAQDIAAFLFTLR